MRAAAAPEADAHADPNTHAHTHTHPDSDPDENQPDSDGDGDGDRDDGEQVADPHQDLGGVHDRPAIRNDHAKFERVKVREPHQIRNPDQVSQPDQVSEPDGVGFDEFRVQHRGAYATLELGPGDIATLRWNVATAVARSEKAGWAQDRFGT